MTDLPIEAFKEVIMASESPYIIVEAETGSGKSTKVVQWFREIGCSVLVTEPLIETVIGTAEYVARQCGVIPGKEVGYRTSSDRCSSPETEILFCTDGLALVRELAGHNSFDVLIIDELHEWNTNQSTLEAWAWSQIQAGTSAFRKVVILSATLDSDSLSQARGNAPVFKVPGRQFPIEDREPSSDMEEDISSLVGQGYDCLVFMPGKAEIEKLIGELTLRKVDAELIPFHGQLDREDKNLAYASYDRPKVVVSTNALETGRTLLPSHGRKLAVVDSGMEKRVETVDGIEGLYLQPIALARGKQRRGRTGRVSPGVYIDRCPECMEKRPAYPTPEILRTRLDQTVLRLAVQGYDATELPFFHPLDLSAIAGAKRSLRSLGAMTADGEVTKTGRLMAKLPVSVQFAKMILEAEKHGVVNDVITIAAILEVGGLGDRSGSWRSLTGEKSSDLLAQLDLWKIARGLRSKQMKELGIFARSYFRARDIRAKLVDVLMSHRIRFGKNEDRRDVLRSCIAGMVEHLYQNRYGEYQNGTSGYRRLARESVLVSRPAWIVGLPKDIQFKGRFGLTTLNLVAMCSVVDPKWLMEIAPQLSLVEEKHGYRRVMFNGQLISEELLA